MTEATANSGAPASIDPPSPVALEMRGITKRFPGVAALSDVSLTVRQAHIHALLGENGAGKSTLMKILDGVYPAGSFEGEILLAGEPVSFASPHDAQRQGIGYVPQEISVIPHLTVAENIYVGHWCAPKGWLVSFQRLYQQAAALLQEMRVDLDPRQTVALLNTSQRQLVMIARALSRHPKLLILDEATACLTSDEAANLFGLVRRLQNGGLTTLFITHKMDEVFTLADRATILRDGAVVANFERAELDKDAIVAAMIGRRIEQSYIRPEAAIGRQEVLRVEHLTVQHPHIADRNIVQDVSFSVRQGEILGLGGLVGSGRSEILNALYGRLPHRGDIFLEGRKVEISRPGQARALRIGLLTEDRKSDGLLLDFPIRENVTLHDLPQFSRLGALDSAAETRCAERHMARFGIRAPSAETLVANLSGGNQQKVVFAKVLQPQPRVLLLDEPTKGVDVGAKHEIYKLIGDLARSGVAMVVVSSELPELMALCDRFVVLVRGRMADEFSKEEGDGQRLMLAATGSGVSRTGAGLGTPVQTGSGR